MADPDDVAAHWSLQRTSGNSRGRRKEQAGQLPQQNNDSKCLGEHSKFNYVKQWTSEGVPHPWIGETDSISRLAKPLRQNPQSMCL